MEIICDNVYANLGTSWFWKCHRYLFSFALVENSELNIILGGQGFVIKLRNTAERSPTSMLLEPPQQTNSSMPNASSLPQWRHMK